MAWIPPNSIGDGALNSGLIGRDQIACAMQIATKSRKAHHHAASDNAFAALVK